MILRPQALLLAAGLAFAPAASGQETAGTDAPAVQTVSLQITGAFVRATPPNAPAAAGYLSVANSGVEPDALIGARTDRAGVTEIHSSFMDGDVMRMRPVEGGLAIPPGHRIDLVPGGFHLMFRDLAGPMVEGEEVTVTLVFEKSGEVTIAVPVHGRNAPPQEHGQEHGQGTGHGG